MKPEEIRIAIAEACGWKRNVIFDTNARGIESWLHPGGMLVFGNLPDYLNDLNAMHEAEKSIKEDEPVWAEYEDALFNNGGVGATADQRAEAFLRATGRWTYDESKE